MDRAIAGFMITLLISTGCQGSAPENLGSRNGHLAPCPDAPNCVSTESRDPKRALPPLPFVGNRDQAKNRILEIVRGMERSEIVEVTDDYVYVRFRTRFLRFVDDVEFLFDDTVKVVHFRSASRVGYYDFGLNRRRMIKVSEAYLKK
jgi:uncharacterized protein (DUF1499 family)